MEAATARLDPSSGLDEHCAALLRFTHPSLPVGGGVGTLECSLRHPSPRDATICGTRGVIRVAFPFWCPTRFSVQRMGGRDSQAFGPEEEFDFPLPGNLAECSFNFVNSAGLAYEAEEVNRCLRAGLVESPSLDARSCRAIMATVTDIRGRFPAP